MAITAHCSSCGATLQVKDEFAGRKGKCPKCQASIRIPEKAVAPAAAPKTTAPTAPVQQPKLPADPAAIQEAILGAFDSRMTPPAVPLGRKLFTVAVAGVLLILPLFYIAALGGLGYGIFWLATSSYGRELSPAVFWIAIVTAALLLLCLLKPLVEPRRLLVEVYPLTADKEPLLTEFLQLIGKQVNAAPPARVQTECSTRLELDSRRGGTLTIGLPLAASLSAEQLAGLIGGQLAHVRKNAGCGPTNLIRSINGWLWRSIYEDGRFDAWLARVAQRPKFSLAKLLVPLRAAKLVTQAVLFIPMFIGNTLAQNLVRQSELDADRAAARLVGRETFAATLLRLGDIEFTWQGVLAELAFLHKEQQLPDSLPQQLSLRMLDMTPELAAALRETVGKPEEKPFDSRPSDADRLAATQHEPVGGVCVCGLPARTLFATYEETARQITFDYYSAQFGAQLLKTGLKKVVLPA